MSKLRISEIFASLQGEGELMGTPSTFIRTSGCNLRCVWCDTPYASWSPEGPVMDLSEILQVIEQNGHKHVVLTGGEPMIFAPLVELSHELRARGHHITIETAGTVDLPVECDLMSISPKLAHSAPPPETPDNWHERHESARLKPETLLALIQRYGYQLKFVVDGGNPDRDLIEIQALLAQLGDIPAEKVFLMPEGRDELALRQAMQALSPICMSHGYRLAPRLQITLYGDTRGT